MSVCRSELVAETSRSSDVLALPDARTREGVPVQPLPHAQTSHRDRARPVSHRATDQDLVSEPPHEVEEGDTTHQGAERVVLRPGVWPVRSRRPQGPPRCPLGRFHHRPRPRKQDRTNTLAPCFAPDRSVAVYPICFPPSVAAVTTCDEANRSRNVWRCFPYEGVTLVSNLERRKTSADLSGSRIV